MASIPRNLKLQQIKEIEGVDLAKMDKSMLIDYTKRANQYVNMRMSHLTGSYEITPAKSILKRELGDKKIKWNDIEKMTPNQLRHTLATYKKFLNSQTSTKSGEMKRRQRILESLPKPKKVENAYKGKWKEKEKELKQLKKKLEKAKREAQKQEEKKKREIEKLKEGFLKETSKRGEKELERIIRKKEQELKELEDLNKMLIEDMEKQEKEIQQNIDFLKEMEEEMDKEIREEYDKQLKKRKELLADPEFLDLLDKIREADYGTIFSLKSEEYVDIVAEHYGDWTFEEFLDYFKNMTNKTEPVIEFNDIWS